MRVRSTAVLAVLALLTISVVILAFTSAGDTTATSPGSSEPGTIRHTPETDNRSRLVIIGDSITQGDSPAFSHGKFGKGSWALYIDTDTFRFIGGVVKGGMTSEEALKDVHDDLRADVVVYALGTNDLRMGETSPEEFMSNITLHRKRSTGSEGAPAIVVAVGPMRGMDPTIIDTWNAGVRDEAKVHDLVFIDPWKDLRTDGQRWKHKTDTLDGLHPSAAGSKKLGQAISDLVIASISDEDKH